MIIWNHLAHISAVTPLSFTDALTDENEDAITGAAAKLACQMRTSGGTLIDSFTITETDTPGTYKFDAQGDTSKYPIGTHLLDIEYRPRCCFVNGYVFITIAPDQTHD